MAQTRYKLTADRLFQAFFGLLLSPIVAQAATWLPPSDHAFVEPHFSGSAVCSTCHNQLNDRQGNDVSLETAWRTSMMANSARDPLWQAKVASEMKRNSHLIPELNQTCTRCHAPMANVEALANGGMLDLFDDGQINQTHAHFDAAMDGVSCTLCHQINDDGNLGTEDGHSGNYSIDLQQRLAYGPKRNLFANPMINNSGFTPLFGAHIQTSEVCATCHDLKTPFVDADGTLVDPTTVHGGFPEQMVYTEWDNSAYAVGKRLEKSCQDCHMPETDGVALSSRPGWIGTVNNFSQHSFVGANTVMMDIIDRNSEALGATSASFDSAIQANRDNLRGAAEIKIRSKVIEGDRLKVRLAVHNLSGHKLPTGYPSRRAYLHFRVKDQAGDIVFESGRLRKNGRVVGINSDGDSTRFEPHHDRITQPWQVQVYEAVMGDTDGNVTHTLLRAATHLKDNRLLPAGLNKHNAPLEIAVHGRALDDSNFNYAWDVVRYDVALPAGQTGDTYDVLVELRYQPLSYAFLSDLFQDAELPAVASFQQMYEDSELRTEIMARKRFSLTR